MNARDSLLFSVDNQYCVKNMQDACLTVQGCWCIIRMSDKLPEWLACWYIRLYRFVCGERIAAGIVEKTLIYDRPGYITELAILVAYLWLKADHGFRFKLQYNNCILADGVTVKKKDKVKNVNPMKRDFYDWVCFGCLISIYVYFIKMTIKSVKKNSSYLRLAHWPDLALESGRWRGWGFIDIPNRRWVLWKEWRFHILPQRGSAVQMGRGIWAGAFRKNPYASSYGEMAYNGRLVSSTWL